MLATLWSRMRGKRGQGSLALGSLEKTVMEGVWRRGSCTVRDLYDDIGGRLAYTTVMTTLDRLHKKGLLSRHKDGKAFVYEAKVTREDLDRKVVREVIGVLVENNGGERMPILSCFVDAITEEDEQLLAALEEEIKKRRNGGPSKH